MRKIVPTLSIDTHFEHQQLSFTFDETLRDAVKVMLTHCLLHTCLLYLNRQSIVGGPMKHAIRHAMLVKCTYSFVIFLFLCFLGSNLFALLLPKRTQRQIQAMASIKFMAAIWIVYWILLRRCCLWCAFWQQFMLKSTLYNREGKDRWKIFAANIYCSIEN